MSQLGGEWTSTNLFLKQCSNRRRPATLEFLSHFLDLLDIFKIYWLTLSQFLLGNVAWREYLFPSSILYPIIHEGYTLGHEGYTLGYEAYTLGYKAYTLGYDG